MDFRILHWGMVPYKEAWERQTQLFNQVIEQKLKGETYSAPTIIFCQHPHVYTLGKNGKRANLLVSEQQLLNSGAELFRIDRGGDITYHGPGQLVCYPILDLEALNLGVKQYVHCLEQAVIDVCRVYDVEAGRAEGATGVWLDVGTQRQRKICAIGIRASHFVTMHGLALNVNTDLRRFQLINPCGFTDKAVTSLSNELHLPIDIEQVEHRLTGFLIKLFK